MSATLEAVLVVWLVAGLAFALWLRRHDRQARLRRSLAELPDLVVTIQADITAFEAAMRQAQEAGRRWIESSPKPYDQRTDDQEMQQVRDGARRLAEVSGCSVDDAVAAMRQSAAAYGVPFPPRAD